METGLYVRVSTEEQAMEGYSVRGQVEKLQAYVSAKSWSIFDVYLDEGISGKNITQRPAINRLIEDIKAGRVKNVLVYKLDRLTRSVADLVYLIDLFNESGCAFNSLSESIDTSTASGRMFIKIIGIFAEFERENIGERVRLGKERKAKEGYTTSCAITCYGYQRGKGEKVQEIVEAEAATVRRMFDLYVHQNLSLSRIAKTLNVERIPSKQNSVWNAASVGAVLRNCNYIGNVRYAMDTPERYFEAEGRHEAIISEELFKEAQILLEQNKRAAPTNKPVEQNYFAGLVFCGLCGRKRKSHTSKITDGKGEHRFICTGRVPKLCDAKSIAASKLEREVAAYIAQLAGAAPDVDRAAQAQAAKQAAAEKIAQLQKQLAAFDDKEQEMLDSYIANQASFAEYRGVKARLDGERQRIAAEIERLTPSPTQQQIELKSREEILHAFNAQWGEFSEIEKRQFLVKYFRKIIVINHPVEGTCRGRCEITDIIFNI